MRKEKYWPVNMVTAQPETVRVNSFKFYYVEVFESYKLPNWLIIGRTRKELVGVTLYALNLK